MMSPASRVWPTIGVDEHVWHHTPHRAKDKGTTMLTGMVDLTRDCEGRTHARLLDLVPGRTGKVFGDWLSCHGEPFRKRVEVATLDPFRGYANAIDDHLDDAVPVLDAFHVVKLGGTALDEVRRRVQQTTLGRRGHAQDPLYRIRNILRRGLEHLTPRQGERLDACLAEGDPTGEVQVPWGCYQQLRAAYQAKDTNEGKRLAEKVLATFHTCPIPEIARLGKTLRRWKKESWATSPPTAPTTVAPRRSTESSNCTGASHAATATATTTDYACSWPQADYSSHRNSEEPGIMALAQLHCYSRYSRYSRARRGANRQCR
jgi:transposase